MTEAFEPNKFVQDLAKQTALLMRLTIEQHDGLDMLTVFVMYAKALAETVYMLTPEDQKQAMLDAVSEYLDDD